MLKKILIAMMGGLLLAIMASLATAMYFQSLTRDLVQDGGVPLAIKWEGLFHDLNFRDLGESLNQCLATPFFLEGRVTRANVMFSGWDCERVGNPQIIYSLNYAASREERYFCRNDGKAVIGRTFNPAVVLNDLEFMETWQNPAMKRATCLFLGDILQSIGQDTKIMIHCDAGRDRTGTVSAILAALAAENVHALDNRMIEAIECDYRKSATLQKEKYGRMKNFLTAVAQHGGVTAFLKEKCSFDEEFMRKSIAHWRQ